MQAKDHYKNKKIDVGLSGDYLNMLIQVSSSIFPYTSLTDYLIAIACSLLIQQQDRWQ